jgi:hypothetical protein
MPAWIPQNPYDKAKDFLSGWKSPRDEGFRLLTEDDEEEARLATLLDGDSYAGFVYPRPSNEFTYDKNTFLVIFIALYITVCLLIFAILIVLIIKLVT